MHRSPFVLGLAAVFAGLTAVLLIFGVVGGQPVTLFVAAPLGAASYVMYYHGSGKLARRVHRTRATDRRRADGRGFGAGTSRGGFGAGPRSRGRARTRAQREARAGGGRGRRRTRERAAGTAASDGPSAAQARRTLGVGTDADAAEIKRAYRERVKEVHPDRGGDEEAFKRVNAAYDRLSD